MGVPSSALVKIGQKSNSKNHKVLMIKFKGKRLNYHLLYRFLTDIPLTKLKHEGIVFFSSFGVRKESSSHLSQRASLCYNSYTK